MPQFEQIQRRKQRRKLDQLHVDAEGLGSIQNNGGGPDESEELLDAIDELLHEVSLRNLGASGLKSE